MTKDIIRLENVWKIYQMGEVKVPALRGLNLRVRKGEFLAIMGSSGSGKSTSMNMIGCLDVPTKGKVFLEDQNISHLSESDLAQIRGKKIGFIFQTFNLISTLSALDNVALPMIFQNIPKEERVRRSTELLEMVGLSERIRHKPSELSGGQQQRVAIARSLINDPEVILADEPTGNLDSESGHKVIDFLQDLHKREKKTIVMVTHDEDIAKNAERLEYLYDGQIVKQKKHF
ncbi:ABC transporter ATP-binding protein [Candidatus Woesearchaeota archaeon]|nr:ABC transporter ATP-binding protein [Candidatus Woesearchaeota archaeon]